MLMAGTIGDQSDMGTDQFMIYSGNAYDIQLIGCMFGW